MATQNLGRDRIVELMRRVFAGAPFDVALMPRGDVALRGLAWVDKGVLEFRLGAHLHGVDLEWDLVAHGAHSLKVDLNYVERDSQRPFSWDTLIEQDADQLWLVMFDFASAGEVRFMCSELEIRLPAGDAYGAQAVEFVVVLEPNALENPDTDLAILVPQAIEQRTDGLVVGNGWAYAPDESMHLYFQCAESAAGLRAIQSAFEQAPICGNDLRTVLLGCRADQRGPYTVLAPPGRPETTIDPLSTVRSGV